jgi:hypothetical protein
VHLTSAGFCTITASQLGDASYNVATDVSRTFRIANPTPRSARALAASGRWGSKLRLRFQVIAGSGNVAVTIAVRKNGSIVTTLARHISRVESGRVYAFPWRAPGAKTKGVFSFCVTLAALAGKKTAPSCAPMDLR